MKLTTRLQYSVKAMLDLSLHSNQQPIAVRTIAERQQLPAPYLEKLLIKMRRAGLVISVRGAQGGYKLARLPQKISLGQILLAVEGKESQSFVELEAGADRAEDWVSLCLWQRLNNRIQEAINGVTLADLYYDARSWQAAQGEKSNFIV
ncbi:MAG: Rrf2 family transcriptional regulator [Synechococcaceae cyanobacterium RL_1_2]|nr:Rrf2 family transcriptional regulator [Synechococcaceae cyanobacterium RL_1_2]